MDSETQEAISELLEMVREIHSTFQELKPTLDRYKKASNLASVFTRKG